MKGKLIWSIFWALVGIFVVIASVFLIPVFRELLMGLPFITISGAIFFLLGVALIIFTVREEVGVMSKVFLILTGAAAIGIPVSIFLHNAIYGLFIHWFGADFWDRIGVGDEPLFFIMAVLVCPSAFLVGAVGSIVCHQKAQESKTIP